MNTAASIRQDPDYREAKYILTNISNRHTERYYYPSGNVKFSIMQVDTIHVMDVLERLVDRVDYLERQQPTVETSPIGIEVRKRGGRKPDWWVRLVHGVNKLFS